MYRENLQCPKYLPPLDYTFRPVYYCCVVSYLFLLEFSRILPVLCPDQIKKKEELIVVDSLLEEGLQDGDLPHLCLDKTLLMSSGHK